MSGFPLEPFENYNYTFNEEKGIITQAGYYNFIFMKKIIMMKILLSTIKKRKIWNLCYEFLNGKKIMKKTIS